MFRYCQNWKNTGRMAGVDKNRLILDRRIFKQRATVGILKIFQTYIYCGLCQNKYVYAHGVERKNERNLVTYCTIFQENR